MLRTRPTVTRLHLRWLAAAAMALATVCATAQPARQKGLKLQDNQASARALSASARLMLLAVERGDLVAACPGKPRPKVNPVLPPDDRRWALQGASSSGVAFDPGRIDSWGLACEPGGHQAVQASLALLKAMGALMAQAPEVAGDLRIKPESPDEAKRLSRGLALVLGSLGKTSR